MLSAVLLLSGCADYFENTPDGSYFEEDFFKNINEMQGSLDASYSVMRKAEFQRNLALIGDALSDDYLYEFTVNQVMGFDAYKLCIFEATPDNQNVTSWYSANYQGILYANTLLKHINDSITLWRDETNDEQIRHWQYIYGQGLFLRAFYYFNLVKSFGGVPIVPEDVVFNEYKTPRASVDSVYAYIERDLRTAAVLLPKNYINIFSGGTDNEYGQATRYAALSYLLKVLVYQAKPGIPSAKWQEAKEIGACLTGYVNPKDFTFTEILKPEINYPGMTWEELKHKFKFDQNITASVSGTNTTEFNKPIEEAIFQKSSDISSTHGFVDWGRMWRLAFQNDNENTEPVFIIPTQDIRGVQVENTYNYIDYLYVEPYYAPAFVPTMSLINAISPSSNKEPRKYYGVISHNDGGLGRFPTDLLPEHAGGLGTEQNYYISIKRWLHSTLERPVSQSDGISMRNIMLMRYSEVVLLYAEALNECGNALDAVNVLNKIRENLKISKTITADVSVPLISYGPYSTVRDLIYNERRMELHGEFDRFFDIVRRDDAAELINYAIKIDALSSKRGEFVKGKHELLPIPQNEIDLSHGIITQNPGY